MLSFGLVKASGIDSHLQHSNSIVMSVWSSNQSTECRRAFSGNLVHASCNNQVV